VRIHLAVVGMVVCLAVAGAPSAVAAGTVGTSFPGGFPVITDASLGTPVIGFGAAGPVTHTPVIFLHGNNDTPFPTFCNPLFGAVQKFAQFFADHGYAPSELWALGYQGNQCDLFTDPTKRSGVAHSTLANVPDLRAFVHSVLAYTGAKQVDIVGHSLGVTLAREWMREDQAYGLVRRFVAIDGPNHGIVNCSPSFANYWQIRWLGGFTPQSALCQEYGSPDTPFLALLNRGGETPGPTRVLVIRNADTSFAYFSRLDGFIWPVPSTDYLGRPNDFSQSATLQGAHQLDLTGQGRYDRFLRTAHLGILASPDTWQATLAFLTSAS
jgi:pimeloyl-ACP methyl ester carboxylesterase